MVDQSFSSKIFSAVVEILKKQNRENLAGDVGKMLIDYGRKTEKTANVILSQELNLTDKKKLEKTLLRTLNLKDVLFEYSLDQHLIDGLVVTMGDKRWDFSLSSYLERFKNV